ncbi:MAG: PilZ domain-containing protein [Nitrospiraceae bacterium]|nr:PilZ domain-containing protein [Nitrospiraceae bacterium]
MARLDARCKARIPVIIMVKGHDGNLESVTSNLGLGGAFINSSLSLPENTQVKLRAPLPTGELEVDGTVLRQEQNGVAVKFLEVGQEEKSALWEYIKENIGQTVCPFCGAALKDQSARCNDCGMETHLSKEQNSEAAISGNVAEIIRHLDSEINAVNAKLMLIENDLRLFGQADTEVLHEKTYNAINDFYDFARKMESALSDNKDLLRKKQAEFRNKTDIFFSKSYFMNHARTWPKGYPGDYKLLEAIYRNIPLSEGVGYLLDSYFLSTTLANAVRTRLSWIKDMLKRELKGRQGLRVLNIASGSTRELFELAVEIKESDATFTCVDLDSDAINFVLSRLSYTDIAFQIAMRKYNALRMASHERNIKEFGLQDNIYSIGLFDYLTDDVLVRLLKELYLTLNPGGKLIASFKDCKRYETYDYHWLVDWSAFYQRTEAESRKLIDQAGIPENCVQTERDLSGVIIFYTLVRP